MARIQGTKFTIDNVLITLRLMEDQTVKRLLLPEDKKDNIWHGRENVMLLTLIEGIACILKSSQFIQPCF